MLFLIDRSKILVIEKERKDKEVLLQEFKKNEAKLTSDLEQNKPKTKKLKLLSEVSLMKK
jgi:hypothetical protein